MLADGVSGRVTALDRAQTIHHWYLHFNTTGHCMKGSQVEPGNDQEKGHQAVYQGHLGEREAPPPLLLVAHSGT